MASEIKKESKKNGYMSQSEFIRDIYRYWKKTSIIPYLREVPEEEITNKQNERKSRKSPQP